MSIRVVNPIETDSEFFEVQGAGQIQIGKSPNCECGTATGFALGVEWGSHGYTGGVIDAEEAKKLADFIYDQLGCKIIKIIEVKSETDKN